MGVHAPSTVAHPGAPGDTGAPRRYHARPFRRPRPTPRRDGATPASIRMSFVATLLLLVAPQLPRGGDIQLPPRKPVAEKVDTPPPLSEIERFRRDVADLHGTEQKVELKLQQMAGAYAPEAIPRLVLDVVRSARAHELRGLMVAARRFCTRSPQVADELLFQLLSRPLGDATRPVLETMAFLKGDGAKAALKECVRGRIAGARRHATELIGPLLAADDLPFALELSRESTLDLQLRGIDMLKALSSAESAGRLVELLSKDPSLAGAACPALVTMRGPAVAPLQQVLQAPRIDRGFAYAAFALAQIAAETGPDALPASLLPALAPHLTDAELLSRSLVAVAVADLLHRGAPSEPATDVACAEALLDVVQPLQFVPNLDLLRRPCEERLQRATGRVAAAGESLSWRAWWKDQKAAFVAVRDRVELDARAAGAAVVIWRQGDRHVRLLAEGVAGAAPVQGATELLLDQAQMAELLAALEKGGIFDEAALHLDTALPRTRVLELRLPAGRAQAAMPADAHPRFDALVQLVQARCEAEAWQLYRDASKDGDRAAFWRAERQWRDAHPSTAERGRRFVQRAIAQWGQLTDALRARAIEQVLANPERKQVIGEEEGVAALAALDARKELGELDLRLLELAAAAPGDRCWRGAVDLASRHAGGGRAAIRAVFAVLGPDAVLQALSDPSPLVRRAGIDEIMVVRDQRAAARLVELLADADPEVARGAAIACGHLQVAAAQKPLVERIVVADTDPSMRQDCLRALGRVGGELAFPTLQRALMARGQDDRDAAMRGMGDLRDPRAAHVLVDLVLVGFGKDFGALARVNLKRQPARDAVAALLAQVEIVQDRAIKDDLVLLLGEYHDPVGVPYLLDLLRSPRLGGEAAVRLEATTGLALVDATDRVDVAEAWYRKNRDAPQWQWLLDALKALDVATTLNADQFGQSAGLQTVPELARLLVEAKEPRVFALCGAVARTVTGEDLGLVTMQSNEATRAAIAARCRVLYEAARTAQGR